MILFVYILINLVLFRYLQGAKRNDKLLRNALKYNGVVVLLHSKAQSKTIPLFLKLLRPL